MLFRSLPYPNDRQLVSVGYFGPVDNNEFNVVSSYLDWRRSQSVFQDLTSMRPAAQCDLMAGDTPYRIACFSVEANFLRTLGLAPAIGRDFTVEDDQPHAPPVALLVIPGFGRAAMEAIAAVIGSERNRGRGAV